MIPFGPWAPDQPYLEGALADAVNVIPYGEKYRALPTASPISVSAVAGTVVGGFGARLVDGNAQVYVGTTTALNQRNGATWTDVSVMGGYSLTTGRWEFTQYGSDVYAISLESVLQKQTGGVSAFAAVSGGPKAACIANVRQWVVVGDVDESGTLVPHKVRWCQINDPDSWTISEAAQSGSQLLDAKDGRVMSIKGGEYGLIFQQHAITRMVYAGAPIVWQFDKIDSRNGCEVAGSAVQVGRTTYFLSHDGWRMTDGSGESVNIGDGLVNNWFRSTLDTGYKSKIKGAYNPDWRCVVWVFPSTNGGGANDSMLLFHVGKQRWAHGSYGAQVIFEGATSSVTLEGLDAYFATLEDVSPSMDDPFWVGGEPKFLGVSSGLLEAYDNTPGNALLETYETEPATGSKTRVVAVQPVIDGTTTVQVGYRNTPDDTIAYTPAGVVNTRTGVANFRHVSRWQRYRFNISGEFAQAVGYNVNGKPAGIV